MKRLDEKTLRSLCNLEKNEDFKVIIDWFLDSLAEETDQVCKSESSVVVYRAQGAIRTLKDFCEAAAEPRELAGKLRMEQGGIRGIS